MYCYKGTNITGEKVVNHFRTQLIDALIESYGRLKTSHGEGRPCWRVGRGSLEMRLTRSGFQRVIRVVMPS